MSGLAQVNRIRIGQEVPLPFHRVDLPGRERCPIPCGPAQPGDPKRQRRGSCSEEPPAKSQPQRAKREEPK
eukprot:2352908-Rhodomonas_salina.2